MAVDRWLVNINEVHCQDEEACVKTADLRILIQEGEGTTLEFKESISASVAREIVAMANTIGGRILFGVRDNGTVVGMKDTNILRARIQDIARNCDPPVKVIVEPVEGVLVAHVRESEAKPVQCSDGFFWRQGAGTQKLSRDEIRDFFRAEGAIRFDLSPCPRFRYPQEFDNKKFAAWLALSGITGRPRTEDVLVNIEAAERAGGKLLFRNAGVLFFAKNVRHFFTAIFRPNPEVRARAEVQAGTEHLASTRQVPGKYPGSTPEVTPEGTLVKVLRGELDRRALQAALGLKDDDYFRIAYLLPALRDGLIEMTIPDKPRSSKQRYRLTEAGTAFLQQMKDE